MPADAPFQKVRIDDGQRAGVMAHPYLLATFAYSATSSPIHRGVFLSRGVLGRALRPPPEAAAPLAPDLHPSLSTRERVALQTSPAACMTCHGMINPLGFPLERFDAVGRYRAEEKGKPIDARGSYLTRSGERPSPSTAPASWPAFLAGSDETRDAFIEQLFHHLVKQAVRPFGPDALGDLRKSFERDQSHVRKLCVEIAATAALAPRPKAIAATTAAAGSARDARPKP